MATRKEAKKAILTKDVKRKYTQGAALAQHLLDTSGGKRGGAKDKSKRSKRKLHRPPTGGWIGGDPKNNGLR